MPIGKGRRGGDATAERVFFALWPDDATREAIRALAHEVVPESGGRPVPEDNYHITLRFLGTIDAARLKKLRKAAGMTFGLKQSIRLDRIGFWEGPAVLWLGCGKVHDDLLRLVVNLNTELGGVGFPHEDRPFKPHVTLARQAQQGADRQLVRPLEWRSEEFVLVSSTTDHEGSTYRVLERYPLRDPAA